MNNIEAKERNLEAAKKILEQYKNITRETIVDICDEYGIEDDSFGGEDVMSIITGFGNPNSCILCQSINKRCEYCFHVYPVIGIIPDYPCPCTSKDFPSEETYTQIEEATSPEGLLEALQNRIKYFEEQIQKAKNMLEENKCQKN